MELFVNICRIFWQNDYGEDKKVYMYRNIKGKGQRSDFF